MSARCCSTHMACRCQIKCVRVCAQARAYTTAALAQNAFRVTLCQTTAISSSLRACGLHPLIRNRCSPLLSALMRTRQGLDLHSNPFASLVPQAVMDDHGQKRLAIHSAVSLFCVLAWQSNRQRQLTPQVFACSVCVCVCVRACVRARASACARVCVLECRHLQFQQSISARSCA